MKEEGPRERRVLVVVGTRPEAIKMAPVIRSLRALDAPIRTALALTGQHSDLVDEVLQTFELEPDWDLEIMRADQTLTEVAVGCLAGLDRLMRDWVPNLVLVQGDTASVFFAALSGFFHGVPRGHVEAGLRTGTLAQPFPEEGFRRLTGVLADLHFAPTEGAAENLRREGVPDDRIEVTGNPVVDALLDVAGRGLTPESPVLKRLLEPDAPPFLLLTFHRRESYGAPAERVFEAIRELVDGESRLEVVFPVHPNPRIREPARRLLGNHPRIHLTAPLGYADLVTAVARARGVLTDSGGLQEEAPTFGTPVLVLREVTERLEGVRAGAATLVGTDPRRILEESRRLLGRGDDDRKTRKNPYGDGRAGERIARRVERFLFQEGGGT